MTVNQATLTVMASNANKVYGAAIPSLSVTYAGFVAGDSAASLTTQPTATTAATASSPVGAYAITAAGGASSNYTFNYTAGTLTVTKAMLTISADNKSKTQGTVNPALTVSYSGFVLGETSANLTAQPTATTTAVTASPVGTYPITASGAASNNYDFTYVAGTLTVTEVAMLDQTITFNALTARTYGNADFAAGATASSGLPVSYTSSNPAVATIVGGLVHIVGAGTTTITASQAGNGTYNPAPNVPQSLTVNQASLTVTAAAKSKTYGAADPALTYTTAGLVGSDTTSGSLTRAAGENVGTYAINRGTVAASTNYNVTYVSANLTINTAALTITAAAKNKTYGAVDPALTYTATGFVNGDTSAIMTGSLSRAAGENVGNYAISQGTLPPEATTPLTYAGANLTINAAPLTITAAANSKTYGAVDPALTYTATGFVNGDTSAIMTGSLTRAAGENVGNYAINQGDVAATSNYTATYAGADLTINAAPLTITAAANSKTYGAVDPALTYTATGFVNGDTSAIMTGSLTRAAGENVGNYAISQGNFRR